MHEPDANRRDKPFRDELLSIELLEERARALGARALVGSFL